MRWRDHQARPRRRSVLGAVLASALLMTAVPGVAATLTVQYEITGGTANVPTVGEQALTGGSLTLRIEGTISGGFFSGFSAVLETFSAAFGVGGIDLISPISGAALATAGASPLSGFLSGTLGGVGPNLVFSISLLGGPFATLDSVQGAFTGVVSPSGGYVIGSLSDGFYNISYEGQEVSTTLVPEPGSGWLLTTGLLGLVGASRTWLRRRGR